MAKPVNESELAQNVLAGRDELIRRALSDIQQQPDRVAAIVLAAIIEDLLMEAIIARRIIDDPKRIKTIFRGIGPLATFSAKIDIGFLLGLYPTKLVNALHAVRRIRNKFAHEIDILSFETPEIRKLAAPLEGLGQFLEGRRRPSRREAYIGANKFLLAALYVVKTRRSKRVPIGRLTAGEEE